MENQIPQRKNIRLKEYDYSLPGAYFITICTKNKECTLSNIKEYSNGGIDNTLTKKGKIIEKYLNQIHNNYSSIIIDEYVIMPNHVHVILIIKEKRKITVSKIIQQFKGIVTKEIGEPVWQKLFYERIIRNEKEYLKIKQYVINNPTNWKKDKYF